MTNKGCQLMLSAYSLVYGNCNTQRKIDGLSFISHLQMDILRSLKMDNSSKIVDNYRPVQPLNDRTVKRSFMLADVPTTTDVPKVVTADGIALKTSKVVLLPILFGVFFML